MRRLIKLRRFKEFLSTYVPFEFSDVNLSRDAQFDAHQPIIDPTQKKSRHYRKFPRKFNQRIRCVTTYFLKRLKCLTLYLKKMYSKDWSKKCVCAKHVAIVRGGDHQPWQLNWWWSNNHGITTISKAMQKVERKFTSGCMFAQAGLSAYRDTIDMFDDDIYQSLSVAAIILR